MKIQIGTLEIILDIEKPSSRDILELKLKEIINANNVTVRIKDNGALAPAASILKEIPRPPRERILKRQSRNVGQQAAPPRASNPKQSTYAAELEALHQAGFVDKMIVSIANKILGVQVPQTALAKEFGQFEKAASKFMMRLLDEEIWALYAAPIQLPGEDLKVCIVGLNEQNQLIILSVHDHPPASAFRDIIDRGLDPSKIQLGILSFHLGAAEEFKDMFPDAAVQLDWNEYIDLSVGAETKLKLRNVNDDDEAEDLIQQIKAPSELLTYLDFPKELHRAIKSTTPIKRISKEINLRAKKATFNKGTRKFVTLWCLMRLQYYWLKVPVDSSQLANLKYIRSRGQEVQREQELEED